MILSDYSYIFIVTYARSGSTLLQSLINAAPGVDIKGENTNALYHLYKSYASLALTAERGSEKTYERDNPWYGAANITVDQFLTTVLTAFIADILRPVAGTKVTGFKEVRYGSSFMDKAEFKGYTDFLLRVFPNSRIVCNSRNAEEVAKSGFLKDRNAEHVIRNVERCDIRFQTLVSDHPKRCIAVRHGIYNKDFENLRALFDFLELEFDEDRVKAVLEKPLVHAKGPQARV